MENGKKRYEIIDILKAIGIISVVIGHCGWRLPLTNFPIGKFVYSYHIMVFMFVLGFLFKSDEAKPYAYIGKTICGIGKLFITYAILFALLHNVFVSFNMINAKPWSMMDLGIKLVSTLCLTSGEVLLSAFWFLPMYIFIAILFCCGFYFIKKRKYALVWHLLFVFVSMFLGVFLSHRNVFLTYHAQTSFLAIPVCYLGYITKKYWDKITKFVPTYGALISALCILLLVQGLNIVIDVSQNKVGNTWLFYLVTFVGLYFCVSLAKCIDKFKISSKIFCYIGKNSFHIMALHFMCIKLFDIIYGAIIHADKSILMKFPYSFNLPYVYYIVGIGLPLLLIAIVRGIKWLVVHYINKRKEKTKPQENEEVS